jgi:hypothetical protein
LCGKQYCCSIIGTCKDMPHYDPKVFCVMHYIHNLWTIIFPLEVRCLTPLSKIFQLLLLWRKLEYPEKSTDLSQVTDKLYHIMFYRELNLSRRDRMVVEFTTTRAMVAYHHLSCEFEPHSCRGVLDKTLCDKVCQWLATDLWISLGTPISATKVVTEIFWKWC